MIDHGIHGHVRRPLDITLGAVVCPDIKEKPCHAERRLFADRSLLHALAKNTEHDVGIGVSTLDVNVTHPHCRGFIKDFIGQPLDRALIQLLDFSRLVRIGIMQSLQDLALTWPQSHLHRLATEPMLEIKECRLTPDFFGYQNQITLFWVTHANHMHLQGLKLKFA